MLILTYLRVTSEQVQYANEFHTFILLSLFHNYAHFLINVYTWISHGIPRWRQNYF